jgi:hypothetical protein
VHASSSTIAVEFLGHEVEFLSQYLGIMFHFSARAVRMYGIRSRDGLFAWIVFSKHGPSCTWLYAYAEQSVCDPI